MKINHYFQYYFGLTLDKVIKRKVAEAEKARAKAMDGLAYAKAMLNYHTAQVNEHGLKGPELLEAQLAMLEAQEGVDYAQTMLGYYNLRQQQLQLLKTNNMEDSKIIAQP